MLRFVGVASALATCIVALAVGCGSGDDQPAQGGGNLDGGIHLDAQPGSDATTADGGGRDATSGDGASGDGASDGGADGSSDARGSDAQPSDASMQDINVPDRTEMGGDSGPSCGSFGTITRAADAGACSAGRQYTCGADQYEIDCECPAAMCTCTMNGNPVGNPVSYSACPSCISDYAPIAAACGIPY
jgi:hypothetical protein